MEISKSLMNWPILSMLEPEFISNIDMVVVHGILGTEALIVTRDKMVYALGRNKDGGFGLGETQCLFTPRKVDILCEKSIKTFAHGSSSHVLALTDDGKVYSWGNNSQYQLGNKADNTNFSATPALVQGNLSHTFVVDIACGHFHSLALTGDGQVYEWGIYRDKQCFGSYIMTPRKVQSTFDGKRIVCISCGGSYSMAVTADGEVYGWGDNEFGQLGIGNYNYQEQPCKVTELTGIVIEKVMCGSEHTLALSNAGILYTWGANTYGQLGCSAETLQKVYNPIQIEIPLLGRVLDMAASHYNHISVVMEEGNRVFVWGHVLCENIISPTFTPYRCLYDALACYAVHGVMHKPFLLHVKGMLNLTDCLKGAFDDPTNSDLAIQVEECPIHVHKAILKIRCQHFRTMSQEHWAENNQSVIEHEQFSYDVYRAFLEYLYTDEINLPIEYALEFLDLTNSYSESNLRSHWIRLIKKDITIMNAIRLYNAAIQYNAKELEEYCFQFAVNHLTAVARRPSFFKLDQLTKETFTITATNAGASKTLVAKSYQNFKTTTRNLMAWKIIRLLEPMFILDIHMVIVFNFGCAALIVTKDGTVYGIGKNNTGCLGTGDTYNTSSPREITALSGKGIKTFAYWNDQSLALTENGEVYVWGCPYDNIKRYKPTSQNLTPTLVEGYPRETFMVDLACGKYHSLALTSDGKVYAWGKNTYGQVDGIKPLSEEVCGMVGLTLPGKKIVNIGCCSASSMAVTDGGEVYSWGYNTNGELGQGDCNKSDGVHKVQIPTKVVIEKVACGQSHTLALSNKGVLYVWGANTYGQLGLGHTNNACTPVKLQVGEMRRVLDVAASPFSDISVAMCKHNRVFVWGQCLQYILVVPSPTAFECLHDPFAHFTLPSFMHQPLIVYSEEERGITDHLRHAFDDVATSDLTINVKGNSIYVHKAILKLRSNYFRSMFQEQGADNNQSVIEHEQFSYNVYKAYLEYLYTDQIYLGAENIHELLDLAVAYSDSALRDRCIPLVKSAIKVDNVVSIYSIVNKHDLQELKQICFNFTMNNMTTVVQTSGFSTLDASTTQSLIEAAEAFKKQLVT
ncbi:uncharacterized protein LOC143372273 [Andrena cerasifolii]|uniref:uncharacterized protein LOC143372273 n=1 Tax=Andrena cerasifolii TaxID=2819439 RepID=UPI004037A21F